MDYNKFKDLIKNKENQFVDFKITCEAFTSPKQGHKAELVKDICAFANNKKTSYIIIGVSDDCCNFKSFKNRKFTDENIHDLIKNIKPI